MSTSRSLIFAVVLAFPALAEAKPEFPVDIPNGSVFLCATCHTNPVGGSSTDPALNDFGAAVQATLDADGAPIWADVCGLDSDGDGATNGQELGDPDCTWQTDDSNPTSTATNPGDASSAPAVPADDGGCGGAPDHRPWISLLAMAGVALLRRRRTA